MLQAGPVEMNFDFLLLLLLQLFSSTLARHLNECASHLFASNNPYERNPFLRGEREKEFNAVMMLCFFYPLSKQMPSLVASLDFSVVLFMIHTFYAQDAQNKVRERERERQVET